MNIQLNAAQVYDIKDAIETRIEEHNQYAEVVNKRFIRRLESLLDILNKKNVQVVVKYEHISIRKLIKDTLAKQSKPITLDELIKLLYKSKTITTNSITYRNVTSTLTQMKLKGIVLHVDKTWVLNN